MSILVDQGTRVVVQGITGREGTFHSRGCREYGTKIVAGVTPGRGGSVHEEVPVFDTVRQAVEKTGAEVSLIFVPPAAAADAILEAADAGIRLAVCITEGIPTADMTTVKAALAAGSMRLIGPNCPGIISPGKCKIGIMPGYIHKPGPVGVISRSGTLTYEAVAQLSGRGIGQSTCIGIGGDPIIGTTFVDALGLFKDDAETRAIMLIGEIGGTAEEEAARYAARELRKPLVAFVAGQTAPPGKRMGHAGAIIAGGHGTAAEKMAVLKECGVRVLQSPAEIGEAVEAALKESGRPGGAGGKK
ncbi:MAG TPA: succinate--CoA ligase subunit alpha [Candidatus Polarisedimenticolia bacterium]|jgi:succinyl-CoA synthetase alpha subunit|nr:succinate--CoA ligase subunit alpha [Candidatus Polarisedimenticolia bacterium]